MSYKVAVPRVMGRVTNGQRAAVCGLVLAGVPYGYACFIVGIHPNMMARYVGADWRRKLLAPTRWTRDKLDELEEVWRDRSIKTETICELFKLTASRLGQIAKQHGFPLRRRGPMPKPKPPKVSKPRYRRPPRKTPEGRHYDKLCRHAGVDVARREFGIA